MRSLVPRLVLLFATIACGGDDGDGQTSFANTTLPASTGDGSGSSTTASSTTAPASSSESSGSSSEGAETSSSSGAADSTGGPEDPSYPAPDDGGACPPDHAPIELGGGSLCAPFCAGADAACPAPSSGDAIATCTPFEDRGGSGTACATHDDCPDDEACGTAGTCVAVAFWACRLECAGGQTCSDGMTCITDACGYP
jgi:hypothetical protein